MTTAVQHRRGTTAEHAAFTGLEGELTIDTTKDTAVIHDGTLTGGYPLAKENLANVTTSGLSSIDGASTASDDKFFIFDQSATSLKTITRAELNNAIEQDALANVAITGGTINGTTIGATTASTGAFTTLTTSGNTTLGDASTDTVTVNGYMGVGGAGSASYSVKAASTALTGIRQYGFGSYPVGTSAATTRITGFESGPQTADSSFTVGDVVGFFAAAGSKGAASTATNWHGIYITDQTQGTNNYGITSAVSSGTNKWNIYASGTAANYFAGDLLVGTTSSDAKLTLRTAGSGSNIAATFGTSAGGVWGGVYVNAASPYPIELYGGTLRFKTGSSSYASTTEKLAFNASEAVFNDPGADYDFRVESDTNTHAFFLEGSSGNVGIGTSSPATQLDIASVSTSTLRLSNTDATLSLGEITGEISFYQADTTGGGTGVSGRIGMRSANRPDAGTYFGNSADMAFYVSGATDGAASTNAPYEALTLRSNGNVGIGTSSPAVKLETTSTSAGATVEVLRLSNPGAGANTQAQLKFVTTSTNYGTISGGYGASAPQMTFDLPSGSPGNYVWQISSSEKMRLDKSGNLGLGVTPSASWWASIKSLGVGRLGNGVFGSTSDDEINIGANVINTGSGTYIYGATDTASLYRQVAAQHVWYYSASGTAGAALSLTEAMRIDSSGNVGIGTSSPQTRLHVSDSDANSVALFERTTTGSNSAVAASRSVAKTSVNAVDGFGSLHAFSMQDDTSGRQNLGYIGAVRSGADDTGSIVLLPVSGGTATERMRLDSSGNLGIGTSSPGAKLDVVGASGTEQFRIGNTLGGTDLGITVTENGSAVINSAEGATGRGIQFQSGGTNTLLVDSSGNLGLGVTPSAWNAAWSVIDIKGSGAVFASTSNAADASVFLSANMYADGTSSTANAKYKISSEEASMYRQFQGVHSWFTAPSGTAGNAISFSQAMTLDASGRLLVGTTSAIAGARMSVVGDIQDTLVRFQNQNATTPGGLDVHYSGAATNNADNWFYLARDSSATRFYVKSNGGIANFSANDSNLSDRREKTNFAPAKSYLETICAIPVQTFNYIDQNMEEDGGLTLGVVAQDVQAVAPELVMESNWGTEEEPKMRLSVYQTDLQYALMKCIQEQQALITALTARVAALESI